MNNYYLELMGLRMVICASHNISISERLRPFLCDPQECFDCTITLESKSELPLRSENGVWHGLEYYDYKDGEMRAFHFKEVDGTAFAVTRFLCDGNILLEVKSGFESYFEGSSGIFNRIGIEALLLQHKGLLLHASLIEYEGNAIAFTGPSGIGKSTQAEIWRSCFGADIVNGDRAAIRNINGVWTAFGSPYAGSSGIYKNKSAPLSAIVILKQAKENRVTKITAGQAFSYIYPEISVHHWDRAFVSSITDICLDMLSNVPIYYLECLPNEDAAYVLRKGLLL